MAKSRRTYKKQRKQKRKTQKIWNMFGCAKCMRGGMRGGSIGCAQCTAMHGGSQTPLVGSAWGASPTTWPKEGQGNHYSLNSYPTPQADRILRPTNGGSRRRRRKHYRGGVAGFNVLSQLGADVTNAYRGLTGTQPVPSPLPWKGQMVDSSSSTELMNYLKIH